MSKLVSWYLALHSRPKQRLKMGFISCVLLPGVGYDQAIENATRILQEVKCQANGFRAPQCDVLKLSP